MRMRKKTVFAVAFITFLLRAITKCSRGVLFFLLLGCCPGTSPGQALGAPARRGSGIPDCSRG